MPFEVKVEVKTSPSEYHTITLTEGDLMKLAEQKAEDGWFCYPSARAESVSVSA